MSITQTPATTVFYSVELTEEARKQYEALRLTDAEVQSIVLPPADHGPATSGA